MSHILFSLLLLASGQPDPGRIVQYGAMRDVLAMGHTEARVRVAELTAREHFFAVGAVEGLGGEITILDSQAFVTYVDGQGALHPVAAEETSATMLLGASVPVWEATSVDHDVAPADFEATIRAARPDSTEPFFFVVDGEFLEARVHVIRGACPVHARMNKIELPPDERPFEHDYARVSGTVVGLYAADAVGKMTHPATSVHAHLIFMDPVSGERVTAHLERVGVAEGAMLRVPGEAGSVQGR